MFASRRNGWPVPSCLLMAVTLISFMTATSIPVVLAASTSSPAQLKSQAAQLKQQAALEQSQAQQQRDLAQRAAANVLKVQGQIKQVQSQVSVTDQTILSTQEQIRQQDDALAVLQGQLAGVTQQQNALIRDLYIAQVSYPQDLLLFSSNDIGTQARIREHIATLEKSVTVLVAKTNDAAQQAAAVRDQLVRKQGELTASKTQQQIQQQALADFQLTQSQLQQNAAATEAKLESQAAADRAQEGKLEAQVNTLLSQAISQRMKGIAPHGSGVGERVRRGDIVGNEGSTGFSTGPHTHQEVRLNGSAVNPQPYISSGTIRWALDTFTVTQGFGHTNFSSNYSNNIHAGIDISGPFGEPVHAPADGTVILNAVVSGYGHAWAEQLDSGLVVLLGHMI